MDGTAVFKNRLSGQLLSLEKGKLTTQNRGEASKESQRWEIHNSIHYSENRFVLGR